MNTRQPPPQGAPPSYAFVTRVYRRNLRPVVISVAVLGAIWALFSTIGHFRSASVAKSENFGKLATFSIVLGALYAAIVVFESFGVFAAATQRLNLVRIYAFLAAASALIVVAGGLLSVVVHFTSKNDIIQECTNLAENQDVLVYPFGLFGPVYHDFIDRDDANNWCRRRWDHDSWSLIVSLLLTVFLAGLMVSIAFSYYRQLLDPSSPANFFRGPQPNAAPSHYNPAYGVSVPNLGYGYNMPYAGGSQAGFAPPPGPPPQNKAADHIGGDGTAGAGYQVDKGDDPFADFEDTGRKDNNSGNRPGVGIY